MLRIVSFVAILAAVGFGAHHLFIKIEQHKIDFMLKEATAAEQRRDFDTAIQLLSK